MDIRQLLVSLDAFDIHGLTFPDPWPSFGLRA
jgi:hypothetical protein